MKTPDQYFDSKVYPSGVVVQSTSSGWFYSTDGQFSVIRPERAQLLSAANIALLRAVPGNDRTTQEVKIPTLLDYLAATANAMGKPGAWLNAHNGVDARIAHFVLSVEQEVKAEVWIDENYTLMPGFSVEVTRSTEPEVVTTIIPPYGGAEDRRVTKAKKITAVIHRSTEPTTAHVILQLMRWRTL